MKKIIICFMFMFSLFFNIDSISCLEYNDLPKEVSDTFENFFEFLSSGNTEIFNIIDSKNMEFHDNVNMYLNNISIVYEINNVEVVDDNHYKIYIEFHASGIGWNVSGMISYFEIKQINDKYKIVNTDLFEFVGIENVMGFIFKILLFIACIFAVIMLITFIIVLFFIKKKNKNINNLDNTSNLSNNFNQIN